MSLLVGSTAALPAITADLRDLAEVRWENHKALVCLVGENIRRQPDIASRVFAAVSDMDVRVVCQDASDRTISFLVEESKVEESVQRLHANILSPSAEPYARLGRDLSRILSGRLRTDSWPSNQLPNLAAFVDDSG